MGYMRHHAIVVTSWKEDLLKQAHDKALELEMSVSNITDVVTNCYQSFLIAPDGSKEGWDESDKGDENRREFIEWADGQRYDDDSTALSWVEVQFGDEELETVIVADSDARRRNR